MQYFITPLDTGELRMTVTIVKEFAVGRFVLISPVGKPGPEMLHHVTPVGRGARLELTFRWPAGIPNGQAVSRSMADAAWHRVRAFEDLIEN
jgi:hypothetical protein